MENIVDKAENAIKKMRVQDKRNSDKLIIRITGSQIRKILSVVNILKNKVDVYKINNVGLTKVDEELQMEIDFLRVNVSYQAGRDNIVKDFVEKADLLNMIKVINGDIKAFENFCKYVEALVAFHKFYGGRD